MVTLKWYRLSTAFSKFFEAVMATALVWKQLKNAYFMRTQCSSPDHG